MDHIEQQIAFLPFGPGVYKFLDSEGNILYIGKASSLRSRVRSYFRDDHADRPHIIPMIPLIQKIDFIETANEIEAVVLESAMIKQYLPKYNVELKDDKSYAWIYINTQEKIPTIKIVRSIRVEDYKKGRLFGPYPNGRAVWQVFRYIRKLHPFCTCNNPKKPCLYYRMGLCNNPAFGEFTVEEYREGIKEIIKFLSGRKKNHINDLKKEMLRYSSDLEYEKAALLRDKINDLEHLGEKIPYYQSDDQYIQQKIDQNISELEQISEDLGIIKKIKRIECYDISNISGKNAYGSMSVFENGTLKRSEYRIFKIKNLDTPNDYAMLEEVVDRRLGHIDRSSDISLSKTPDIILIDGGKGQISKLRMAIPEDIILLGISKGRSQKRKGGRQRDQFWTYIGDSVEEIYFSTPTIFIRLRDEAHRFAIKHHRNSRKRDAKRSVLDSMEGVGDKRRKKLIKRFGSVEALKKASYEEINTVIKNKIVSKEIFEKLKIIDHQI